MARKKVVFETFLDGLCSLWRLGEDERPTLLLSNIRYKERTVGERRNYDAEQAGHTIQRLIRIPRADFIAPGVFVTIEAQQYRVLQAQQIMDTLPHCTDLTLENPEILAQFDESEVGVGGRL